MTDDNYAFALPPAICLIISGIWLLAGQGFFADKISLDRNDTVNEAVAKARFQQKVLVLAAHTRNWMSRNLIAWPEDSRRSNTTMLRAAVHPFLHTGLFCLIASIVVLAIAGGTLEIRNGTVHYLILLIGALLINAIALWYLKPSGPLLGCWPLLGAIAASLLIGPHGDPQEGSSFASRVLGLICLIGLYFDWQASLSGLPTVWQQWIPATLFGAVAGLTAWLFE